MEEFPFSQEDWKLVEQASWSIANATVIEDDILAAAGHAELEQVLAELTAKYGEHPILVETAAEQMRPASSCMSKLSQWPKCTACRLTPSCCRSLDC